MQKRFGTGTLLVPSPREIEAAVRKVRKGSLTTVSKIRQHLAEMHSANDTCPMTTGILLRIVAEAAEEQAQAGSEKITPYWRVVKDDGALNPKLPGGVARQSRRLRDEGHRIVPGQGKRPPRVADPIR